MAIRNLPTLPYFAASPRPKWPAAKTAQDDVVAWCRQTIEGGAPATTSIVAGAITPLENVSRYILVDTESAAATDDLDHITTTNVPEGSLVMLRCADAARVVTVKNGAGGAGELATADGVDVKLDNTTKRIVFRNIGGTWVEVWRVKLPYLADVLVKVGAYTLTAHDIGKVNTNEGTGAIVVYTLPTAAVGWGPFLFYVQDADGIRITAGAGDTIRIIGSVSSAAGTAESTTVGSYLWLVAINATEWVAIVSGGTWALA